MPLALAVTSALRMIVVMNRRQTTEPSLGLRLALSRLVAVVGEMEPSAGPLSAD
jgi:hypothetical protein